MKLKFKTEVHSEMYKTFESFDQSLFRQLSFPLTSVRFERFDGMDKGDEYKFYVSIFGLEQFWHGLVLRRFTSEKECYFIEIGKKLPFPLTAWTHKHKFITAGTNLTTLVDEVEYRCRYKLLEYILLPFWYSYFYFRLWKYRKIFNVQ